MKRLLIRVNPKQFLKYTKKRTPIVRAKPLNFITTGK
jgi:hypothetical protein